jgi:hypothetical protein
MEARALDMLARIGDQLDQHVFPCVVNGGVVVLNDSAVPSTQSTEKSHGRRKERGPAAGPRQGATGRQGLPGGPRPSGDAASVIGSGSQAQYEVELRALEGQYPGAQFWHQEDGIWILSPSQLLPGIRQHAMFLTGIAFPGQSVRSWAFWADPIASPEWIGPRHTNFPDGSICAFEPLDDTWTFGDPIVQLLDIYTVWALRHLYLREFARWPGHQSIHFAGERLLELRGDEHCGCSNGEQLYADCCMPLDLAGNPIDMALDFLWMTGGVRRPPEAVERFVRSKRQPPSLRDLVTPFSMQTIHFISVSRTRVPYPKAARQ